VKTIEDNVTCQIDRRPIFARVGANNRGFSLVEVMVAATIFTALAMSGTALFIQNQRASVALRYRTQVTNTALNILEQLRVKNFVDLRTLRETALASKTATHTTMVLIADPTYTPPSTDPYAALKLPAGLRPIELKLNVVDAEVINDSYTVIELPMESAGAATKLNTRHWLTLKFKDQRDPDPSAGGIVQAMEVALVYQWRMPQGTVWHEGTIRLTVANPQAYKIPAT
jgi:prepilin-type N-terminal cleavage/methylation domain-containing protein